MADAAMERYLIETAERFHSSYFGKYRGLVTAVDEKNGRIQAQVPNLLSGKDSPWALPAVPFAGPNFGLLLLPEVNDIVWIEFEEGNLAVPIWTGFVWADNDIPKPGAARVRVLVSKSGHKLVMDDAAGKLQLLHSDGAEITMTKNDITLKIGTTQMVLSSSGVNVNNGALEVK